MSVDISSQEFITREQEFLFVCDGPSVSKVSDTID